MDNNIPLIPTTYSMTKDTLKIVCQVRFCCIALIISFLIIMIDRVFIHILD